MGQEQEAIKEAVARLGQEHSEEAKKSLETALTNVFVNGMLPKDAMGLSDALVEGIYGHAYRLYNAGKYKDASQLFRLLIMLNPTAPKYPLGLAACFHMLKEFENAATTYALVSIIDPDSPIPYYHSSDCYIQMNELPSAVVVLEMAAKLSEGKEQFTLIRERSLFSMESLKNEIAKRKAEGKPVTNMGSVKENATASKAK